MSTPSPTSDVSTTTEGTVLRNFVDQAIAQQRLATMSPRSAVLSQSAFQSPVTDERSTDNANDALDSGRQLRKRSTESRRKRGNEVARPSALAQLMDVDLSRKDPRDEVMRLREMLKTVERHSVMEAKRASELERAKQEAERRMQLLTENQLNEKQETVKAQQEVRLVQLQLHNAQEEIERRQKELKRIEQQRDLAEAEAKREREKARKLYEQTVAAAAREEGRRLGFQAGFDYARQERRAIAARRSAHASNPGRTTKRRTDTIESHSTSHGDKGKQRAPDNVASSTNDTSYRRPSQVQHQSPPAEPTLESYPVAPVASSSANEAPYRRPSPSHHGHESVRPVIPEPPSAARSMQDAPHPRFSRSRHQPPPRPPSFEIIPPEARAVLPNQFDQQMSPSQLQLKSLLEDRYSTYPEQGQSTRAGPSHSTPPRPFVPPPESDFDREEHIPPSDLRPPSTVPPQIKTPAIQVYEIDIPSAEELNREYSYSQENSIDAIPQLPRDQWLTATSYHELKGPPAPRTQPPPQPWPARPKPKPQQTLKVVNFTNILSRPSLIKTKSQASSWYRSLSWRKKSKTVIDPIAEETDAAPTSADPRTGSTFDDSQPVTATEPPDTGGSQEVYSESQPPASWYQANQANHRSGPMSLRSGYSRMRPSSVASTRVSQFDLLATPHAPPTAMSVRDGREGPRNGYGVAGSAPRPSGESMRPVGPGSSQPTFGHHTLQQQSSFGTLESSTQNKRRSRRPPPTIEVPGHDQELEPFGVAFNRGAIANGYQPYNANLNRRPSRISEKTTPDTSIAIDVVPPSGIAPDVAQSPPHTGRNHLSPYHTYQAAAPSFRQSIPSQRTQASPRPHSPAADQPPSVAASRKPSKQSFIGYANQDRDRYQPSPSTNHVQPRPPSVSSRPASAMNNGSGYTTSAQGRHQPRPSTGNIQPRPTSAALRPASAMNNNPYGNSNASYSELNHSHAPNHSSPYQAKPESVRTFVSNRPIQPYSSQLSLNNVNPNGGVLGQSKNASSSRLVLASPLHRVASNSSFRSQGSYSKYDPTGYVDPAFWPPDGPPPPPPVEERQVEGYFNHTVPKVGSSNSGLSYMSDPRNS